MFLLVGLIVTAGVGGGVWWHRRQAKAAAHDGVSPDGGAEQEKAQKRATDDGGASPPKLDSNAGAAGAAAIAGAVAAAAIQEEYLDPSHKHPATDAAAPLIGAGIAAAVVLETGPQAVVIVPVLVLITFALSLVNNIEDEVRYARREELRRKARALLDAGQGIAAFQLAQKAWVEEQLPGVAGDYDPHNLYDARTVTVQAKDGQGELPIIDTLERCYADARAAIAAAPRLRASDGSLYVSPVYRDDPKFQKSKALGDKWADAFQTAVPWLARGWLHLKEPETYEEKQADKTATKEAGPVTAGQALVRNRLALRAVQKKTAPPVAGSAGDAPIDVDTKKDRTGGKALDTGGTDKAFRL